MVIDRPANTPAAWSSRADRIADPATACGWTVDGQTERFAAVLKHLDFAAGAITLLDFGCGTGAFSAHLPAEVAYCGYDWAAGMVARGLADHPTRRFTDRWPDGRFDAVVSIGAFNLPGSKQHTFQTLRHLWDSTRCSTLVASLYAGTDENCLIYTEAELERVAADLAFDATVERCRRNDLLLVARR